jgi:hypothetical protein
MDEPTHVENLDSFDLFAYYEHWHGDLDLPSFDDLQVSATDWEAIVRAYRDSGIDSLDEESREILLRGAAKTYLTRVENASFQGRAGVNEGSSFEIYGLEEGIYGLLVAWEFEARGLYFDPSGLSAQFYDTPLREVSLYRETMDKGLTSATWTDEGVGQWQCDSARGNDGYHFVQSFRYMRIVAPFREDAEVESATQAGRQVLRFSFGDDSFVDTAWLDADTLMPIGYDMRDLDGDAGPSLPHTLRLTGLNLMREVTPPPGVECEAT